VTQALCGQLPAEGSPGQGSPTGPSPGPVRGGPFQAAGFGSLAHLVRRFLGSLWPGGPSAAGEAWVAEQLRPGERALWELLPGPDRRHGLAVARRTLQLLSAADRRVPLDPEDRRALVAAALLHDVGKVLADLGALGRAGVTAWAVLVGREELIRERPAAGRGWRARADRYLRHDQLGAGLLAAAGSAPWTVAWAREHHLPPDRWTLPRDLAQALKSADDD
jgi:hypothetical protein